MKVTVTAMLNTISAYWHMIGVGVIVVVLLVVPDDHRSLSSVFTETVNATGWGGDTTSGIVFFYVFLTGLLMAQYTITGFDASAHVAEETRDASRAAAVGMYMSVVASVIFGFILLVAVTQSVAGRAAARPVHHPVELGRGDGPELGHVHPLHLLSSRRCSASQPR